MCYNLKLIIIIKLFDDFLKEKYMTIDTAAQRHINYQLFTINY